MENKSIKLTVSGEIDWDNDLSQSLCSNDQAYDIEAELDWDFDCSERLLDYQLSSEFEKESTRPLIGKGPTVHIGFDSEFVPGDKGKPNTVLSLQFYLIGEGGIIQRVIYPPNISKRDRPSFDSTINFLIMEAIEDGVILQWPKQIIICGFFPAN
jgi:hypothetical protein